MRHRQTVRRSIGLGVVAAALAATSAQAAPTPAEVAQCSAGAFSQPFLSANDSNWYTLVPGETAEGFGGEGWELTGGATVTSTTVADGTTQSVLDLPSGSKATSPVICVTSAYPTARAMVRDVVGSEGVSYQVSYVGSKTWERPKTTGQIRGADTSWTLSNPVHMHPENAAGWQLMRITLVPGGDSSEFQVYNLYIDPRMSR